MSPAAVEMAMIEANGVAPYLLVTGPAPMRGRRIPLLGGQLTVGRAAVSDVWLDEPSVSRRHAVLRRRGAGIYVEDAGSTGGTTVNGVPVTGSRLLRPGDVVAFAAVEARYGMAGDADETAAWPPRRVAAADVGPTAPPVRYEVRDQRAGTISNVAGSQYNAYVQQIRDERESFLRDVAATRTKARWLAWSGLAVMLVGYALFAGAILGLLKQGADAVSSGSTAPPVDPFGPKIGGIPSGLVGFAIGAVGTVLLGIGIVLHVIAAARRKRINQELPLPPPPWQGF